MKLIDINLLPQVPTKKVAKVPVKFKIKIDPKKIFKIILIGLSFQILLTIFYIWRIPSLKKVEKELEEMKSKIEKMKKLQQKYREKKMLNDILKSYVERKFMVSYFFDRLIEHTPEGVWFSRIVIKGNNITLIGSVVSLRGEDEASNVNKIIMALTGDEDFKKIIKSAEIETLRRKTIGSRDVLDFTISCVIL